MQKIAIIGANEFQNPLILKAKEMGFETHVFAWEAGEIGEHTADFFYPISIIEKEQILQKCREIGVATVVSVGSDLASLTVNYVARNLGLPCNDAQTDLISTNKYWMREAFKKNGIPTPKHVEVDANVVWNQLEDFSLPVIVKPTDRSGSRGVYEVESEDEFSGAVLAACTQSFSGKAIVEEYIEGKEYSCECISWDGNHRILAFTKKYTTNAPHFIETGHDQPADIPGELMPEVETAMIQAMDALKIRWGASHIEFRITPNGQVRLIEVGARMGGDCIGSDLVPISTGYDFLRMVIDVSIGKTPDFTPIKEKENASIRFIMKPEDIRTYRRVCEETPERICRTSLVICDEDHAVMDSSSRLGYYILRN